MIVINKWPQISVSGSKRTNIDYSKWLDDWFVGSGKDASCCLEGSWWDMICLARNILASENTKLAAPEYYHPEWANDNWCGESIPYCFRADGKTEDEP